MGDVMFSLALALIFEEFAKQLDIKIKERFTQVENQAKLAQEELDKRIKIAKGDIDMRIKHCVSEFDNRSKLMKALQGKLQDRCVSEVETRSQVMKELQDNFKARFSEVEKGSQELLSMGKKSIVSVISRKDTTRTFKTTPIEEETSTIPEDEVWEKEHRISSSV